MELNSDLFSSDFEIKVNEFYSSTSRSCGIYKDDECFVLVHTFLENSIWKDPVIAITKCNPNFSEYKKICSLESLIRKITKQITSISCTPEDLKNLS